MMLPMWSNQYSVKESLELSEAVLVVDEAANLPHKISSTLFEVVGEEVVPPKQQKVNELK